MQEEIPPGTMAEVGVRTREFTAIHCQSHCFCFCAETKVKLALVVEGKSWSSGVISSRSQDFLVSSIEGVPLAFDGSLLA